MPSEHSVSDLESWLLGLEDEASDSWHERAGEAEEKQKYFLSIINDPRNLDKWIGVQTCITENGTLVEDPKWIEVDEEAVRRQILKAKCVSDNDNFGIYSPDDPVKGRRFVHVRGSIEQLTDKAYELFFG